MDLKKDFNIVFSGLKLGQHQFEYNVNKTFFDEFEFEEFEDYNIKIKTTLDKKENMLVFTFDIKGSINTECDRCAESLVLDIEGENTHYMNFAEEETELDDDDISILKANTYEVNISELIYEYIIILIPTKRVHINNKKCEAILDDFSFDNTEDENNQDNQEQIDPRWAALKKLK